MTESNSQDLSGVAETLLLPLYFRAIESQRSDALIMDEIAVRLVQQASFDFSRIKHAKHDEEMVVAVVLRNREFDRQTREFLSNHTDAAVVHLGCGLDSRFERVDDGKVEWYDLDLPEVIALRKRYIMGEKPHYRLLAKSLFDPDWMDEVAKQQGSFLFIAEGVFMYFPEEQVKSFILGLCENFPGAELVFDAFSPFFVWANNLRVRRTGFGSRAHWGLKHPKALEGWGDNIHLLSQCYPFMAPEPRLAHLRWVRFIPMLSKTTGIFHYNLG